MSEEEPKPKRLYRRPVEKIEAQRKIWRESAIVRRIRLLDYTMQNVAAKLSRAKSAKSINRWQLELSGMQSIRNYLVAQDEMHRERQALRNAGKQTNYRTVMKSHAERAYEVSLRKGQHL